MTSSWGLDRPSIRGYSVYCSVNVAAAVDTAAGAGHANEATPEFVSRLTGGEDSGGVLNPVLLQ